MANLTTKYLDYNGLNIFLQKLKEYISDRITEINGSNLNLYSSGDTNPTITSQIEDLWGAIGNSDGTSGSLAENIANILGQYVKDIKNPETQNLPIKIKVEEGVGGNKDIYTISLTDNGLTETLEDLTDNRVSKLDTQNTTNNLVTISCDKNVGEVKLIVNDAGLLEALENIQSSIDENEEVCAEALTNLDSRLKIVEDGFGGITSNYVKSIKATGSNGITATPATAVNGEVEITISGSGLEEEINDIKSNYLKTSDVPTKLPNPNKLTITDANGNAIEYDGSVAKDINSISHSKTSDTASDSDKLDGKDPSYYATKESVDDITSSYVKSIKATGSDGITATPTTAANGVVEITISGSGLKEEINDIKSSIDENEEVCAEALTNLDSRLKDVEDGVSNINNYTINSKKISENPTLTGNDITLGVSVGDNTNYPTTQTISASIQTLRETIAGLGHVMELKGVLTSLPSTTTDYENGDVIIVGSEEYVCYNSNWYLLGHTTEIEESLESLISLYNGHKHTVGVKGSIESDFAGTQGSTDTSTKTVEINSVTSVGTLPTMGDIEVAAKDHTHNVSVTAAGAVESSFMGTQSTTTASDNIVEINSVTSVGTLPTMGDIEVAAKDHTHNVSVMAKGTIENSCKSEQKDTTSSGISSSYNAGVLTITTSHNHKYNQTTSVESTFAGSVVSVTSGAPSTTKEVKQITGTGSLPTIQSVTVSASDHTHNYTPTGTVESIFTGESVSVTSGAPSTTKEVKQITGTGSLPTIQSVTVSASDHTHNYTPSGTVISNIDISVDTGEPNSKFTTE